MPPEVPHIVGAAPPISGAGFAWAACSMSRRWTSSRRAASAATRRWRSQLLLLEPVDLVLEARLELARLRERGVDALLLGLRLRLQLRCAGDRP